MKKILILLGIAITLIFSACSYSGHHQQTWHPKTKHHHARNQH